MNTKQNGSDMEKILIMLGMALLAAFGTIMLIAGVMEVELMQYGFFTNLGWLMGTSGLYFGIMLYSEVKCMK